MTLPDYYVHSAEVAIREDRNNEFKGHRNFTEADIPQWCLIPNSKRRSQTPISRALCGFLNTGEGGTVYLGIIDSGRVCGFGLVPQQMVHLRTEVDLLLARYTPPVPKDMYSVSLAPVIASSSSVREGLLSHSSTEHNLLDFMKEHHLSEEREHIYFNSGVKCWCERVSKDIENKGVDVPKYVVHITIHPWRAPSGRGLPHLHPIYENEESAAYIRMTSSLVKLTFQDVADLTKQHLQEHFRLS